MKKPCSYCKNMIPDSGVWGLSTYTDVPENHKPDCPIREMMEVSIANASQKTDMKQKMWAFWDKSKKEFKFIFPSKVVVEMCFPDGGKSHIEAGTGDIVEVEVNHLNEKE